MTDNIEEHTDTLEEMIELSLEGDAQSISEIWMDEEETGIGEFLESKREGCPFDGGISDLEDMEFMEHQESFIEWLRKLQEICEMGAEIPDLDVRRVLA